VLEAVGWPSGLLAATTEVVGLGGVQAVISRAVATTVRSFAGRRITPSSFSGSLRCGHGARENRPSGATTLSAGFAVLFENSTRRYGEPDLAAASFTVSESYLHHTRVGS
jgi:hypothetical protein